MKQSLWQLIKLWFGGTSVSHPKECKICHAKVKGNFFTGYYLPCEREYSFLHQDDVEVWECPLSKGPSGHFSSVNYPNCRKCGACGFCGGKHSYYQCEKKLNRINNR